MLEAAKAALEKAGFTIESLRNRIKELEAETSKLKEPKTCFTCHLFEDNSCTHPEVEDFYTPSYIKNSGCGLHEQKDL